MSDDAIYTGCDHDLADFASEPGCLICENKSLRSRLSAAEKAWADLSADFGGACRKLNEAEARLDRELKRGHDLAEQVAALQSKEVCGAAHDDDIIADCPWCKLEAVERFLVGDLRPALNDPTAVQLAHESAAAVIRRNSEAPTNPGEASRILVVETKCGHITGSPGAYLVCNKRAGHDGDHMEGLHCWPDSKGSTAQLQWGSGVERRDIK